MFVIALGMPALADHDEEAGIQETGTVLLGAPEQLLSTPCEFGEDPHGVSYNVTGFDNHTFSIQPDATLDVDPIFYDAECESLGSGGAPLGFLGAREFGIVPDNATALYVWGYAGTGTFNLTI